MRSPQGLSTASIAAVLVGILAGCAPSPTAQLASPASLSPSASVDSASPVVLVASAPASPVPTSRPQPSPSPRPKVAVPPKPSGVKWTLKDHDPTPDGYSKVTITVTWDAPRAKGTTIKAYGVTRCFTTADDTPCLAPGTALPDGSLVLIKEASAAYGKVTWTWPSWELIGRPIMMGPDGTMYEALVIGA